MQLSRVLAQSGTVFTQVLAARLLGSLVVQGNPAASMLGLVPFGSLQHVCKHEVPPAFGHRLAAAQPAAVLAVSAAGTAGRPRSQQPPSGHRWHARPRPSSPTAQLSQTRRVPRQQATADSSPDPPPQRRRPPHPRRSRGSAAGAFSSLPLSRLDVEQQHNQPVARVVETASSTAAGQQHWQNSQVQQQAQQQATVPAALYVEVEGVVHEVKRFDNSQYKVLIFKEVASCSNGTLSREGWAPNDIHEATLALEGRATTTTSSRRSSSKNSSSSNSSNSSGRDGRSYAAMAAARRLTVVGHFPVVRQGAKYRAVGEWNKHDTWGWQITAQQLQLLAQDTKPVNLLKGTGIGEKTSELIARELGGQTEAVLSLPFEEAVTRLRKISGIGDVKAANIKRKWDAAHGDAATQLQLQQELAMEANLKLLIKLLAHYQGQDVKQVLQQDPYAPYRVVPGYTLQQADSTAAALGCDPASTARGAAYLQAALVEGTSRSQTCMPWPDVEVAALTLLQAAVWRGWPPTHGLRGAAELLVQQGKVVVEEAQLSRAQQQHEQQQQQPPEQVHQRHRHHHYHNQQQLLDFSVVQSGWSEGAVLYLQELYQAEQDTIAFLLAGLKASVSALMRHPINQGVSSSSSSVKLPVSLPGSEMHAVTKLEKELTEQLGKRVEFNDGQRAALLLTRALRLQLLALTGGPGCGKTLVSQAVAQMWRADTHGRRQLYLAAPTGRAAQRLQEVFGDDWDGQASSTLHRLLRYRSKQVAIREATERAGSEGSNALLDSSGQLEAAAGGPDLNIGRVCEYNKDHPLPMAHYLVDEVSMVDVVLGAALMNALGAAQGMHKRPLMLVGDPDQLPPVGPGQPIADAIAEGVLPCVDLRQIYRTAANSQIVTSAHAVNTGLRPSFSTVWDVNPASIAADIAAHVSSMAQQQGGFDMDGRVLFVRLPNRCGVEAVAEALWHTAQQLLPRLDCNPSLDVQVLSPIKADAMGVEQLNPRLRALFNPPRPNKKEAKGFGGVVTWREGDRVTHLKNDTQLDVYNGDQGYIESITCHQGGAAAKVTVRYPPRAKSGTTVSSSDSGSDSDNEGVSRADDSGGFHRVTYAGADINDMLQLAWATTVHKAQGGEFPVVLMPLHPRCGKYMLTRQLLYTAVSRAQKLLVLVGTDSTVQQCVERSAVSAAATSRFRAKLRSARVAAGLPTIDRVVYGPGGWAHH